MHVFYSATLHRSFVLRGSCTLRLFGDSEPKVVALGARDSVVVPAGMEHVIESCSDDFEMLEVRRLAFFPSPVVGCAYFGGCLLTHGISSLCGLCYAFVGNLPGGGAIASCKQLILRGVTKGSSLAHRRTKPRTNTSFETGHACTLVEI